VSEKSGSLQSVTKSFTTAIILKLKTQGLLKLTDNLSSFFPEKFTSGAWPKSWQNIKIYQLLNMTSGIPGYGNNNEAFWTNKQYQRKWTSNQLVALAANLQKKSGCIKAIGCFPAGTNWNYSNTNYVIASMIAAKLKQAPFSQQMTRLIAPYLSNNSLIYYPLPTMPNFIRNKIVNGYHNGPEKFNSYAVDYNVSAPAASGALVGNMQGMATLVFNLFNGKILSAENTKLLKTQYYVYARGKHPGSKVHNVLSQCFQKECYGLGVITRYNDKKTGLLWTYTGEFLGYRAEYVYSDKYKTLVAIAVNSNTPSNSQRNYLNALAINLLRISCGK
jgi:D-alanyl-D-alanine carboxypeptidase